MPCAMALKHEWCSKDKKLIKTPNGVKYCLFHAPAGAKGAIEAKEFNRLVIERIALCIEQGVEADLSGTVFEHDFLYIGHGAVPDAPHGVINFSGAVFNGRAEFAAVKFGTAVNFKSALFCKAADFHNATFNLEARFDHARFIGECTFNSAHFKEQAHFFDAEFTGHADFEKAVFDKEVYFTLGAFKAGASFAGVRYGARAVFKRPYPGIGASSTPEGGK